MNIKRNVDYLSMNISTTRTGNLDGPRDQPLFQRRHFPATLRRHRQLQPEVAGLHVRGVRHL